MSLLAFEGAERGLFHRVEERTRHSYHGQCSVCLHFVVLVNHVHLERPMTLTEAPLPNGLAMRVHRRTVDALSETVRLLEKGGVADTRSDSLDGPLLTTCSVHVFYRQVLAPTSKMARVRC